jgi:hypothetical protein
MSEFIDTLESLKEEIIEEWVFNDDEQWKVNLLALLIQAEIERQQIDGDYHDTYGSTADVFGYMSIIFKNRLLSGEELARNIYDHLKISDRLREINYSAVDPYARVLRRDKT